MACKNDGSGSYIGYTVTQDGQCGTDNVAGAQLTIQTAGSTTALMIKMKQAPAWNVEIDRNPSPNTADGIGTFESMRFGNSWHHDEMPVEFEWPWESNFNPTLLLGSEGTLRSVGSDGSYWEGLAKVNRITGQPNRVVGEDSIGEIVFSWKGGSNQPAFTGP